MKFKKLEIKNIASLEHATINFETPPLVNSRLFLINGPTGSGKSILLDCICLALYGKAPRLEGLGNRVCDDDSTGSSTLHLSSPLSFVRRGATEAFATLHFTGNDGREYIAHWEISVYLKGAKKGLLNRAVQTLTRVDDNFVLNKTNEVKSAISSTEVVGLDFERFCRTTLLAQGAFTSFLSADETEKAAILKKIVGVEQFARIGTVISEIAHQKKQDLNIAQKTLEGIKYLSDEERNELSTKLSEHENKLTMLKNISENTKLVLSWIEKETLLQNENSDAEKKYKIALDALTSEYHRHNLTIVRQWNRALEWKEIVSRLNNEKALLQKIYDDECKNKASLQAVISEIKNEEQHIAYLGKELETLLEKSKYFKSFNALLEHEGNLKEWFLQLEQNSVAKKNALFSLETAHSEKSGFQKRITNLCAEIESINNAVKPICKELDTLKATFSAEKLTELLRLNNESRKKSGILNNVRVKVYALNTIVTTIAEYERKISEASTEVNILTKKSNELREISNRATKLKDEETALFNKVKMSVSDAARNLRHGLHKGDICPVCNSIIDEILPDSAFEKALSPYLQRIEQLTADEKIAFEKFANTEVELKSALHNLDEMRKLIKNERELQSDKKLEIMQIMPDFENPDNADAISRIDSAISAEQTHQNYLTDRLKELTDIQNRILELNRVLNTESEHKNNLEKEKNAASATVSTLEERINALTQQIATLDNNSHLLRKKIEKIAGITFEADSIESIKSTINNIIAQCKKFSEDKATKELEIRTGQNLVSDIREIISGLVSGEPDDNILSTTTPIHKDVLKSFALNLSRQITATSAQKKRTECSISEIENSHKIFFEKNPDLSPALCADLIENFSVETIGNIQNAIEENCRLFALSESLLHQTRNKLNEHIYSKPEIADNANMESLSRKLEEISILAETTAQEIGGIKKELDADQNNRQKFESHLARIKTMQLESDRWNELNAEFGGNGGERFNRIACAFILNHLLEVANSFLPMLSDRYQLDPRPDSLEIKVYDKISGFSRAFNTLSGGESFIVSLALALALSSVQDTHYTPDTLFIDEGFGTLSAECLNMVTDSLERLQNVAGRRVGIISHVESLRDRIPVQICVQRVGTKSEIEIIG